MRRNSFAFSLDRFTKDLLIIGSGQAIRMALGLVSSVLITRTLGNSDYGIYGVLAAITGITSTLADMGLTTSAAQKLGATWPDKPSVSQERERVYFWTKVGAGAIIVISGLFLARPLARLVLDSTTAHAILLLRPALLGVGGIVLSALLPWRDLECS